MGDSVARSKILAGKTGAVCGDSVGSNEASEEGICVGADEGIELEPPVGSVLDRSEGEGDGKLLRSMLGRFDGIIDGVRLGLEVGDEEGFRLGSLVGSILGAPEGNRVGSRLFSAFRLFDGLVEGN